MPPDAAEDADADDEEVEEEEDPAKDDEIAEAAEAEENAFGSGIPAFPSMILMACTFDTEPSETRVCRSLDRRAILLCREEDLSKPLF